MNILNYEIEDFIGVFDTDFETQPLIDYFHWCYQTEGVYRRSGVSSPNQRKDTMAPVAFFSDKPDLEPSVHVEMGANSKYISMYNEVISQCMHIYGDEYETITGYNLQCSYINVQKTLPKQGYHSWHSEDPAPMTTRRVQPKKGRVVIWPAGFTHTHRGNPPLSGEKYIATAWYSNMNY